MGFIIAGGRKPDVAPLAVEDEKMLHNSSLERTQPAREFMYDVAELRRSARSR